jgi:plastocyanin
MIKAIVAIVIVAALAGGAYAITQNNDDTNKQATSSNTGRQSNTMTAEDQQNSQETNNPEVTNKVEISNFAYSPQNITVKKGTTVTWTNRDSAAHDVVEKDDKEGPKSKLLQTGETYSYTYNTVGTFEYFCTVHPSMTGTVTVTE